MQKVIIQTELRKFLKWVLCSGPDSLKTREVILIDVVLLLLEFFPSNMIRI